MSHNKLLKYINKPFDRLPFKKRATFILHLAGFTAEQIASLEIPSLGTVKRYITQSYKEYDTFFTIRGGSKSEIEEIFEEAQQKRGYSAGWMRIKAYEEGKYDYDS